MLGNHPAYINFTRKHLVAGIANLLPKNRVVIEILENVIVDDELIETIHSLSKKGYKFALDDFVYEHHLMPLLPIADIIKIDVLNLSNEQVKHQLSLLKTFNGKLLAEKIESRQQFNHCKELGFHLFQGYFFNQPDLIRGEKISESKIYLLKLLSELHNPDIPLERVEEIILNIPKLSYRILRLVNSAALYSGKTFDSLLDAVQQLGLVQIRDWIYLLLVSSLDDIAHSLLEQTLIRAKMCQLLAIKTKLANPHQAYTVGMFSTLDAILNEPLPSLLSKVSLSEELNTALIDHKGMLGKILKTVKHYETGDFEALTDPLFNTEHFSSAYLESIGYANQVMLLVY